MNLSEIFMGTMKALAEGDRKKMEQLAKLDQKKIAEIKSKRGKQK